MSDLEARMNELEIRYTEQQKLVQDLSDVVYAQQRSLDLFEAQLGMLKMKLEAEPGLVDSTIQEKPPHY